MNKISSKAGTAFLRRVALAPLMALGAATVAHAAQTDIAQVPLITSSASVVKPNLLFILDDSGSMQGDYMPDDVPGGSSSNYHPYNAYLNTAYGSRSAQCNGVAFNPAISYNLPVDATGTPLASATLYPPLQTAGLANIRTFDATSPSSLSVISSGDTATLTVATGSTSTSIGAPVVLYDASQTNRDPSSSVWMYGVVKSWIGNTVVVTVQASNGSGSITRANLRVGNGTPWVYYTYHGAETKLSNLYTSGGVDTSTNFYKECFSAVGSPLGTSVFTAVGLSPLSGDAQKYMNWWKYYHTRILMMQSAMSLAFKNLDSKYRVGFMKISDPDLSAGHSFLNVADFDATQKAAFYSRLSGAVPTSSTPLRGALSRAGQYFANKAPGQTSDPIQYSCQRNYAILSTDGYWNTGAEVNNGGASGNYGPYKLDNTTTVGQQDGGTTPRPLLDDETTTQQERTSTLQQRTITPQWTTATSQLQTWTITPKWTTGTSTLQQRSVTPQWQTTTTTLQKRSVTGSWQTSTSTLQTRTAVLQARNSTDGGSTWGVGWVTVPSCTWDSSGQSRRQCQYLSWSGWSNAGSCTAVSQGTGTSGTWNTAVGCQYTAWTSYSNTSSCAALPQQTGPAYTYGTATQCISPVYGTWTDTTACNASSTQECQYKSPSVVAITTSCTAVPLSSGPSFTGPAVSCLAQAPVIGAWTPAATCTASSTTECGYTAAVNSTTGTCVPVAASTGPAYTVVTAVTCTAQSPTLGPKTNTPLCTATATTGCGYSTPVNTTTTSCTVVPPSTAPNYTVPTAVACTALASINGPWSNSPLCTVSTTSGCQYTAWTAWSNVASCGVAAPQSTAPNYTVATARECQPSVTGGTADTLADVAKYYYDTDLRTSALGNCTATVNGNSIDVCANNVSPSGVDDAVAQHMTTFTLGLGVNGIIRYQSDYPTAATGDFHDIVQGTKNWSIPVENTVTAVDDLWHAAVDGRGRYFSAGDPLSLAQSLTTTLASIDAKAGFGSAAAASTLQPVVGDNNLYLAKYKSVYWAGDLVSYSIDPVSGIISTPVWSAAAQLQSTLPSLRNIYYFKRNAGANTGVLRSFTYANLSTDGLNGSFDGACSKSPALTQCTSSGFATATANDGNNMVNFLRGGANTVYRTRFTGDADIGGGILGDIIGGAPVYVRKPTFKYTENNYATFQSTINATHSGTGRRGVVYVAANDGMLHAIDGATGNEKWAYIPSMTMNRMYRLADADYANRHEFFVNGAPIVGDIFVPGTTPTWKTILIGGLGAGGRGYYALDITDPDSPVALWEFSIDSLGGGDNLGLTFGNPVITKRADGTWVVAFSSGYNNNTGTGDGNGHLFVVNANTGARILDVPTYTSGTTPAGTATTPSGLGKINAWVDSEIDNTAKRFYGGDLLGNLWRFDLDNLVAPNQAALRMAYFSAGGNPQPITTEPALADVNYAGSHYPVVYVGTGKYLGTTDLGNTNAQTIYAIKDPLTNAPLGDAHASSTLVAQTLSQASANAPRTITELPVDWSTKNGWRVDLISAGERVNVDVQLVFNTLTVASNVPSTDVCSAGGNSYLYQLDIGTGSSRSSFGTTASGDKIAGKWLGGSIIVGLSWITLQLPGGAPGSGATYTLPVDNVTGFRPPFEIPPGAPPAPVGRRTSWRELVN